MKILIVSHPCAMAANQAVFAEMQRITGWDVRIVIPAHWRDEFGNALDQPDWPGLEGRILKVPILFNGNIILHCYRKGWESFLKNEHFDVIYMHHEPYAFATGQVCLANSRLKTPAAFGFYSAQNIVKSYPPPFLWIERLVHATSRFAFPVSQTVSEVLQAKNTLAHLSVCPLPVDPQIYYPRGHGSPPFPRESGEVAIGFVGRVVESKGLAILGAALQTLKDLRWRLHVIGSGDFRPAFDRLLDAGAISDRVTFHGFVPHIRTPEYLSELDFLVVPSETQVNWKEQFGRVIVEAMACGTPVVGSDSGEIPNLVRVSGGGLIFPEKNVPELARALRLMITNPALRQECAAKGGSWVKQNVSLRAVAGKMASTNEGAIKMPTKPNAS